MTNKIYLVGAGPGDLENLTLKALKIIKKADVILYDALVNKEIFQFCKKNALKINVGKRKGNHFKKQEQINELLIKYAKTHKIVVRLKGGTVFVFGRGYEEVRAIKKAGFSAQIISGLSSSTSVPESFMLPLVDRKFNDSYRTITGHDIKIFDNIVTKYHPREILIIMMGIYNLKNIATCLLKKEFPKKIPLSLLSKGTTKNASQITLTLEEISKKDDSFFENIKKLTPAIIFVGQTINSANDIK